MLKQSQVSPLACSLYDRLGCVLCAAEGHGFLREKGAMLQSSAGEEDTALGGGYVGFELFRGAWRGTLLAQS